MMGRTLHYDFQELMEIVKERADHGAITPVRNLMNLALLADRNKILPLLIEILADSVSLPDSLKLRQQQLTRRKQGQWIILRELVDLAQRERLEFMVVKTFKDFPHVPDDIDILTRTEEDYQHFRSILLASGYKVRSFGVPETTLFKDVIGTEVDVDLHFKLSVSGYSYVDPSRVWRNRTERQVSGMKCLVPSDPDDLALTLGHSLLKEWSIRVSDILHVSTLSQRLSPDEILEALSHHGLTRAGWIFAQVVETCLPYSMGTAVLKATSQPSSRGERALRRLIKRDLSKTPPPYHPHPVILVDLFARKVISDLRGATNKSRLKVIREVLSLPKARGWSIGSEYLNARVRP